MREREIKACGHHSCSAKNKKTANLLKDNLK